MPRPLCAPRASYPSSPLRIAPPLPVKLLGTETMMAHHDECTVGVKALLEVEGAHEEVGDRGLRQCKYGRIIGWTCSVNMQ